MSIRRRRVERSPRSALPFVLLALPPVAGCVYEPTEVLVVVDTNAPADRNLELTASVGLPGSAAPARRTWVRGRNLPGSTDLPASFAIVPADGDQQSAAVSLGLHLHVQAGPGGGPPIDFDRAARFTFIRRQTSVLRIYLPVECGAPAHGCTSVPDAECTLAQRCADVGQTCNNAAVCVPPEVVPVPVSQDDGGVHNGPAPDVAHIDAPPVDTAVDAGIDAADVSPRDTGAPSDVPVADTCECSPGATRTVSCGPCANETDTCSPSCQWVAGSCSGTCCTPIAGCTGGNGVGGVCTGNGDDGCGGVCTCNAVNGEQCSVGSGTGTCCHTSGWFCADQSQCCPGLTCSGNICS